MSRYTGPRCRICRRLGYSVCGGSSCALRKKPAPPGEVRRKKPAGRVSDYKLRLLEKQKLRFLYWVGERQFRGYVKEAARLPGVTGENLLRLLEQRLDSTVYRMGFGPTLPAARQLVAHGHITVNGCKVTVPSYRVGAGDTVAAPRVLQPVSQGLERASRAPRPPYLEVDEGRAAGILRSTPFRQDIPVPVDETLVVEHYSRIM